MTSFTAFATEDMHPPVNLSHIRHCDLLYKIRILNLLDLIITSCFLKTVKQKLITEVHIRTQCRESYPIAHSSHLRKAIKNNLSRRLDKN